MSCDGVEGDDSEFKLPSWLSAHCWATGHRRDDRHCRRSSRNSGRRRSRRGDRRRDRRNGATAGGAEASAKAATAKAGAQTTAPPARHHPAAGAAHQPRRPPTGGQSGGGAGGQNAAIANALRQFAAIIPSLIELTASTGGRAEGSDAAPDGEGAWGVESFEGFDGAEGLDEGAAEWAATEANESAWSVP